MSLTPLDRMEWCEGQTKNLPTKFWVEVVYYLNYLLNLVPTRSVNNMNLVEKW